MSSIIIDPIIRLYPGDTKLSTVIVGITAGTKNGSAAVVGMDRVKQVLAAYLMGVGTSTAIGFALNSPSIGTAPDFATVGVSLSAAGNPAGVSAVVLVQGY